MQHGCRGDARVCLAIRREAPIYSRFRARISRKFEEKDLRVESASGQRLEC
jgi:hypothetical protein